MGHVLVEDRQGLIVDGMATTAESDAAPLVAYGLKQRQPRAATLAADRAYGRRDLAETLRELGVVVHPAQRSRGSALDRRTTWHAGDQGSRRPGLLVEKVFA